MLTKIKNKLIIASSGLWTFVFMKTVAAQDFGKNLLQETGQKAGLQPPGTADASDQLPIILGNLIRAFIALLGIIFLILIVYGGWLWLTARGDNERVQSAKDTISRAIIGIVIVTAAYAIANFVINAVVTTT